MADLMEGKRFKWISNLLYEIYGGHHHNDPTRPLLEFISYFSLSETYQDIWKEAANLKGGTPIPRINEVTTNSIQFMCNINGNQMRILRSFLRT